MRLDWTDDEDTVDPVSARERLRSGEAETPPPDNRRIRRAAALLFVLAFVGVPSIGGVFLESDGRTRLLVGLILLAYTLVLGYLMARSIARR